MHQLLAWAYFYKYLHKLHVKDCLKCCLVINLGHWNEEDYYCKQKKSEGSKGKYISISAIYLAIKKKSSLSVNIKKREIFNKITRKRIPFTSNGIAFVHLPTLWSVNPTCLRYLWALFIANPTTTGLPNSSSNLRCSKYCCHGWHMNTE